MIPKHVYLLCRPPKDSALDWMLVSMKMYVAKRVLTRWAVLDAPILSKVRDATRRPRFWQKGGGFDRNVRDTASSRRRSGISITTLSNGVG